MTGFWDLNLLHLLNFYLAFMFLVSLYRRTSQYRAVGGLVLAVPGRWPRLFNLVKQHTTLFLNWSIFLPGGLALGLALLNWLFANHVFPGATITPADVVHLWASWPFLLIFGGGMLAVDFYFLIDVCPVDEREVAKYLDEAEYWLRSWTAPVVNFFTLGRINPRQLVSAEVQKALSEATRMLEVNLWWVVAQTALRVAFGLALWLTFAFGC
jgi:hypothetical protein